MRAPISTIGTLAVYGTLLLSFFTSSVLSDPVCDDTPLPEESGNCPPPGDFFLRIMPLGASITAGDHSPPGDDSGNGYRKHLRDKLRADGWEVNMVGRYQRGTMRDRDHEGLRGDMVAAVNARATVSVRRYKPNVILINAGTNDAREDKPESDPQAVATTHLRMEQMIREIFSIMGNDTVVVLSTLLPYTPKNHNVEMINANYRALYKKLADEGRKIVLAEMNDGQFITECHVWDTIHPTAEGQRRMAAVWLKAIYKAHEKGWIVPPLDSGISDEGGDTTCEKKFGSGNENDRSGWKVLSAANPLISDDGPYRHASKLREKLYDQDEFSDAKFYFAQLVKTNPNAEWWEARDDLVVITHEPGWKFKRKIRWWQNNGGGNFEKKKDLEVSDGCISRGIRWGDVDGDGLDDFICISPVGEMFVSRNMGGNPPKFEWKGKARGITGGYQQRHVRLGDIDGDGRLDYCVIADSGNIRCWRNGGIGQMPAYWQDMGNGKPVFTAKGMGDIRGVRLVDINGDGRADWVWLDKTGKSTIYINQRGSDKSMIPRWVKAASSHGGGFDLQDGGSREMIQFGRVYGNTRADYVYIEKKSCKDHDWTGGTYTECKYKLLPYENQGSGGRFQKGDGAYWGDMRNRGVDDYIWISPKGVINVFPNQNTKDDTSRDVSRGIWGPVIRALETGMDRRALHIGDWDGDGHDDVIGVDKRTGKLTIWITNWDGKKFSFNKKTIDRELCKEGWGIGYFDNGHHFADISGDGRVDYLCMERDGRVTGWINHGNKDLIYEGQVKFSEGWDRANLQFADVNGDGKADMIWTDKFDGNARVYENVEYLPDGERVSGSRFRWNPKGLRYLGSSRGPNMHFPNLGGQGRADMVQVDPTTAHGWCWYNMCSVGGDDAEMTPSLPRYTETDVDHPDLPGDVGDEEFCNSKPDDKWGTELWNKMGMAPWLEQTMKFYVEGGWPSTGLRDASIPVVLSQYDYYDQDFRWTWDHDCTDIDTSGSCDFTEAQARKDCEGHSRRAFALWATRNYAGFLRGNYDLYYDATLRTGLKLGTMSTDFRHDEDDSVSISAILTMVNGILSGIAAFPMGKVAEGVVGVAAGVAGVGAGLASLLEPDSLNDKFDNWAELSSQYIDMLEAALQKWQDYYKYTLASLPEPGSYALTNTYVNALRSGAFANQRMGSPSWDISVSSKMLRASIISGMWIDQKVFLVRYTGDMKFANGHTFNFCASKDGKRGWKEASHCAGNNVNYVIMRWSDNYKTAMQSSFGQDSDKLKDYNFGGRSEVFNAAWKMQERLKSFGPNRRNGLTAILDYVIENKEELPLDDFVPWAIPVCDWDSLKKPDFYWYPGSDWHNMHKAVILTCQKMHYGENEPWPYEYMDMDPY